MKFEWEFCPVCNEWTIICPKCGNNVCNGMYGRNADGGICDVCELAHQYDQLCYKTGKYPKSKPKEKT
jgi:hypothetical protein